MSTTSTSPSPSPSPSSARPSRPLHYLIPLYPCYQLLDAAGPLDILNLLSLDEVGKDITLTFAASSLDPVPIKPIPPKNADWKFEVLSQYPAIDGKVNTGFNQSVVPDVTFEEYLTAMRSGLSSSSSSSSSSSATAPGTTDVKDDRFKPIDVLFIPGGVGTRINRLYPKSSSSSGRSDPNTDADVDTGPRVNTHTDTNTDTDTVVLDEDGGKKVEYSRVSNVADAEAFVFAVAPFVRHSIITVCTGSCLLARTGLLNHRRATTNMAAFERVRSANPEVRWQELRRWVRSLPTELPKPLSSAITGGGGGGSGTTAANSEGEGEKEEGRGGEGGKKERGERYEKARHLEIWTSAGISAGIDVMLAFVAEHYGGMEVARSAAKRLEYEWREIGEGEEDPMYLAWRNEKADK